MAGVNLMDHDLLFSKLLNKLKDSVTDHVAMLYPDDCSSLKYIIEQTTQQFMSSSLDYEMDYVDDLEDEEEFDTQNEIKRRNCNMPKLEDWYKGNYYKRSPSKNEVKKLPKLVIVLPKFERFSSKVLHDFILILSGYIEVLPLVLVFGVATSLSTIGNMLNHTATSKLSFQSFQSQRSVYYLNTVLDKVFFTKDCPFQLDISIFKFLTKVFLFYDFSVCNFIRGIKYCVLSHFFMQPYKIICTDKALVPEEVDKLTEEDVHSILQLASFKKYLETLSEEDRDALVNNNSELKKLFKSLLFQCHEKIEGFYLCLLLLQILVASLPGAPLGKQIRELYSAAMSGNICSSNEFKDCIQLLKYQCKTDLLEKLNKMIAAIEESGCQTELVKDISAKLVTCRMEIENTGVNKVTKSPTKSPAKVDIQSRSRSEFRKKLLSLKKTSLSYGGYEMARVQLLDVITECFQRGLEPVTSLPLHEVILCTGQHSLKRRIVGCPRSDIHLSLTNPQHYLQCECCSLDDPKQITSSLPDICILYKLHLEGGTLINLYDWLMSFYAVINPDAASEDDVEIDEHIQARFTQGVAELEFLGFIKSSERKRDHVTRLTWSRSD